MKHTRFSLAILAIGLLLLGAACQPKKENRNTNDDGVTNTTVNSNRNGNVNENDDNENVNSALNTNSSDDRDEDNDQGNSNTNAGENNNDAPAGLSIAKPEKNGTIESPFEVSGRAYAASVTVRIRNAAGQEVISVPVTVRNNQYKVNISFAFTNTTSGAIEVEDSEGTKTTTPVTFKVEKEEGANSNTSVNSSDDGNDY